ncbi:SPOR domain-containing protein [Altererythrobacter sp. KTW20L]|uniref:SPOR domain-containing protein n=1 Tax=Altererythrobacter sp. KTW20L TaxID=2942210 RepID=UPI0020BDDCA6|nr:SPOR domain-containing protein [Altererythrobacter sp. KTW20L]MCL6251078.1 SPOR domain-containing protein [Altererythrobacter sp. KTW20L]
MRFRGDSRQGRAQGRIGRLCIILASTTALAACGVVGGGAPSATIAPAGIAVNGPQADYPVTIGDPYLVDGTTYRPADVMNYDEVGYLAAGSGTGFSAAHHTLPFPSYVEVTSLETGRTILVRVEQRGPMDSNHLLALSPAAMEQIGATPDTPVRVRRVNAPEAHRALLRDRQAAPVRMDTPMGLVEVLRRRLPAEGSASLHARAMPETAVELPPVEELPLAPLAEVEPAAAAPSFERAFSSELVELAAIEPEPALESEPSPELAPEPALAEVVTPITGGFEIQAAAFSSEERANRAASALGGHVVPFGDLYRVRTGPYRTRGEAEASLANVRAAGYSDARILTSG